MASAEGGCPPEATRLLRQRGAELRQSCEQCAREWQAETDFEKKFLSLDTWIRVFDGEPLAKLRPKEENAENSGTLEIEAEALGDGGPAREDAEKEEIKEKPKVLPRFAKYKRLKEALQLFAARFGDDVVQMLVPKILEAATAEPSVEDLPIPPKAKVAVPKLRELPAEAAGTAAGAKLCAGTGGDVQSDQNASKEVTLSATGAYSLLANLFLLNVQDYQDLQKLYLSSAKAAPQKILCLLTFFHFSDAHGPDGPEVRTLHFQRCARPEPRLRRALPEPVLPVVPVVPAQGSGTAEGSSEAKPDGSATEAAPDAKSDAADAKVDAAGSGTAEGSSEAKPDGSATEAAPDAKSDAADAKVDAAGSGTAEGSSEAKPDGSAIEAAPDAKSDAADAKVDAAGSGTAEGSSEAKPDGPPEAADAAGNAPVPEADEEMDMESSAEGEHLECPSFFPCFAKAAGEESESAMLVLLSSASFCGLEEVKTPPEEVPLWEFPELICCRLLLGTRPLTDEEADAFMAFDAYSQRRPGTREICLGDLCFFAFVGPRLGAEHLVLWRRVADVQERAEQYQAAAAAQTAGMSDMDQGLLRDAPLRLTKCSDKAQLTAAVWRWEKLDERDPNRYWDVGNDSWMYWESFWAPAEDAALAMDKPAFGDLKGVMLQPTLPASTLLIDADKTSILDQELPRGAEEERRARAAMKDKAYSIVYEYNVWGSDVSRSGTGSDLWSPEARLAVTALEAVVDAFGIRSMLDCACGDATWMVPFFVTRHPEIQYTGVDVVSEVIQRNQQRHPRIHFLAQDLSEMPLPQGAQLIFSKETLNHMHLHDAQRALQQFAQTGARYLLTNVHEGVDNFVGAEKTCHTTYIKYDYELPPFSLPKVVRVNEYQGLETSFTLFQLNPE